MIAASAPARARARHAPFPSLADHEDARRASRLVGGASLETAAVPEAAVLLVRRLADPLPHRLALDAVTPIAAPTWERALRSALADCYRTAARPAHGPVTGDVNAVCFEDRAELLACLVRDSLAGTLGGRWWWRVFLRTTGGDADVLLRALWSSDARIVPAILDRLSRSGDATRVVERLSPADAARALREIADAFDLPALVAPAVDASGDASPSPHDVSRTPPDEREAASAWYEAATAPPWAGIAPEVPPPHGTTPERAALLGLALVLARAPLVARSRAFAAALRAWRLAVQRRGHGAPAQRAVERAASGPDAPAGGSATDALEARGPGERPALTEEQPATPVRAVTDDASTPEPHQLLQSESRAPSAATEPRRADVRTGEPMIVCAHRDDIARPDAASARTPRADGEAPPHTTPALSATRPPATETPPTTREARPAPARAETDVDARENAYEPVAEGVRTELGGVFYLVNVLRHLSFFDRLDDWFDVGASVGGWGWIELFARGLLGAAAKWAESDPLWRMLALLDGREAHEPFAPVLSRGGDVRDLPREWLQGVPQDDSMRATRDRLTAHGGCRPLGVALEPRMQRFMDAVFPHLRWRLAAALGLDELGVAAVERLLRHGGLIQVTRTHVDVRMSLASIDVATRRAGLDADPGWVPALARIVTFHFDLGEP